MELDFFDLFDAAPPEDGIGDISSSPDAVCDFDEDVVLHDFFTDGQDDFTNGQDDFGLSGNDVTPEIFLQGTNESQADAVLGSSWVDDVVEPIFKVFDDIYYFFNDSDDIVRASNFSADGTMDMKNNVIVEGNVANDIQFTDLQTHGSCSLMAQEQFVNRYIGQSLPEDYLEWLAGRAGVYSPDVGTDYNGQTLLLEHFHIPHERFTGDIEDLDKTLSENKDVIIGVDAREFYGDATIPPGSGHAVAIVGRGLNPESHEVEGYYVTDSNYPQSAHFVSVEKLNGSWYGDMIAIPEKMAS